MRVPLSWLRVYADLPAVPAGAVADRLTAAGLKVEGVHSYGADVRGVVVGEVLSVEELTGYQKAIRFCSVSVGAAEHGIICGATNFAVGDRVPVALPGATLPGDVAITSARRYGRTSDGMICSARELGVGADSSGILVLPADAPVGADAVDYLRLRDDVLDIEVTPDRGYCFSVRGVAREAATAFDVGFRDPGLVEAPPAVGPAYEVRVEDPAGCDRYVARVVTGLDPTARTPVEMARRLTLAGMRPVSLAVDVTNYVLLELGQPLHAFDRDRLHGPIVVRRAGPGARLETLDGQDRRLDQADLVIADDRGPVALAGVMGGASTEVSAATTAVVLESAHFDPVAVARTARGHRIASEASRRFERGVDPWLAPAAAQAAVVLLAQLGGAQPAPGQTDVARLPAPPVIRLSLALPSRVAGVEYPPAVVRRRLADIGCSGSTVAGAPPPDQGALDVVPPSWRPDLREPIDLVEEVVRLEGYDRIASVLPTAPAGGGLTREQRLRRRVGRALAAAGYVEVLSYPFVAETVWAALGLPADDARRRTVTLSNPLVEDEPALRTSLLPGLLAALGRNVARGTADVALFEEGLVFLRRDAGDPVVPPAVPVERRPTPEQLAGLDAALPEQPRYLAVVLAGQREPAGWWGPGRPAGWADAVAAARTVAAALGLLLEVTAAAYPPWHPGRCAALGVDGTAVGHAGELHPRALAALGLPPRTLAMELDLGPLLAAAPQTPSAASVSAYPVATSDVALVVPDEVPAAAVEAALRAGAGELLESLRLFDLYAGAQVGAGHRSLAYALRLRAGDRTLTVEEVNAARDRAVAEAHRRTGAVLRGA